MASVPGAGELKRLLAEGDKRPKRSLGQNFLVDARAMEFVADSAQLGPHDVVLEPGPGPGGLTGLLAERAGRVIAVELDENLLAIARRRLPDAANIHWIAGDIMGESGRINEVVRKAVRLALDETPGALLKVVSNLPYSISTAFIAAAATDAPVPSDMVVTVQKEVADRLTADTGTKEYGYLSVMVRAVAHVKRLRKLPPHCFWPQPEVDSAVVRIAPDAGLRKAAGDLDRLRALAGTLFTHRRKTVARILADAGLVESADRARGLLRTIDVSPSARPEELTAPQIAALDERIAS